MRESIKKLPSFIQSFRKETQHFRSCLSFGEEFIPVNLGLYIISTMLMVTTCQKPHLTKSSRSYVRVSARGGGTAIGWSTRMLGRIGYAFWVSRCHPSRGIHFPGEPPGGSVTQGHQGPIIKWTY